MRQKPQIWVSRIMCDTTLIKSFEADLHFTDQDAYLDAYKRNLHGEPLPADRFPKEIYGKYPDKRMKNLPDVFLGAAWIVSAEVATVLQQFNLGRTSLYPTHLFQHDRKTPVEGSYFCLNFGEVKSALVPEKSPAARQHPHANRPSLAPGVQDNEITVSETARIGVDMWISPDLANGVFLSDALVQALKAAKLTRRFGLRTCVILDE